MPAGRYTLAHKVASPAEYTRQYTMQERQTAMGEFWGIIQAHLDRYGVREAAFARKIGTVSQTTSNWKHRGLAQLPKRELLEAVARETSTPYEVVLDAVLTDIGYLKPEPVDAAPPPPAPDLAESHVPRPEDNRGVASRSAHAPSRSRVAGGRGTRPPHSS